MPYDIGNDPYYIDKKTGILRNKLGISDQAGLTRLKLKLVPFILPRLLLEGHHLQTNVLGHFFAIFTKRSLVT